MLSFEQAQPSRRAALGWLSVATLWLGGCAIHTPVRMARPGDGDRPDDALSLSLTHARLDPARRAAFDRYTREIVALLPEQPGLISSSVRRELLGDEVWTFTVWRSDEDRTRFFRSGLHARAIASASDAIVRLRTRRVELRRSDLPLNWSRALEWLGPAPADWTGPLAPRA